MTNKKYLEQIGADEPGTDEPIKAAGQTTNLVNSSMEQNQTEFLKDYNLPLWIKQILFYFYKMRYNKYYSCKPYNICLNCEYYYICSDEKPGANKNVNGYFKNKENY